MTTVTATVAACLELMEVATARYVNIEEDKPTRLLTAIPSYEELRQLCSGIATWSNMGLQPVQAEQSELLKNLHQYDFVCLKPKNDKKLLDISQIQAISSHNGQLRIVLADFKRIRDDRLLRALGTVYVLEDNSRIERACWVGKVDQNDCDFTTRKPLKFCQQCYQERSARTEAIGRLSRLRVLSLFGGAGGMDIGLSLSHCRTNWMVDSDPISCSTFLAHHPSVNVIELPVGEALQQKESLSTMPRVGQVDVIAMGPPCQPFSRINRQTSEEREQDPRSLCVATGLSYVETYRPTYGVIENVCGFLDNGDLGRIKKHGIVKFVLVCLASLGYNARIGIVQCNGFGIPQSRHRVLILFANDDVTLPLIPVETHATTGNPALYPSVTICDATSDLPRWDIKNPGLFAPPNRRPEEKRAIVPPSFALDHHGQVVGPQNCNYTTPPLNYFQEQMRISRSEHVSDHYTLPPFESPLLTRERIWNIPLHPNANHLALQDLGLLSLPELVTSKDGTVFKNALRRLDLKGTFPIVLTSISLQSKGGRMLMPDQHRLPSIRELARAQGFPDGIRFQGSSRDMLRQIGNAVPPPLAYAIGERFKEAIIDDFLQGNNRFVRGRRD